MCLLLCRGRNRFSAARGNAFSAGDARFFGAGCNRCQALKAGFLSGEAARFFGTAVLCYAGCRREVFRYGLMFHGRGNFDLNLPVSFFSTVCFALFVFEAKVPGGCARVFSQVGRGSVF